MTDRPVRRALCHRAIYRGIGRNASGFWKQILDSWLGGSETPESPSSIQPIGRESAQAPYIVRSPTFVPSPGSAFVADWPAARVGTQASKHSVTTALRPGALMRLAH